MKKLLLVASLLVAFTASAELQTVLTDDDTLWSVNGISSTVKLDLTRRSGGVKTSVRIPGTEDTTVESHPRLAWDRTTRALFVMWRHGDQLRVARRAADGDWTSFAVTDRTAFDGLRFIVTRGDGATLLHAAWWSGEVAEYALVALDGSEVLSTSVVRLDELANVRAAAAGAEDTGNALHPPLAMQRAGQGVDVAYGAPRSTVITRVSVRPEKVGNNARMWRPSGRSGRRSDPSGVVSSTSSAVQSFIVDGRVVLYTPEARFRYAILENGRWTPVRMLALDEKLTSEELVAVLRRSVLEHGSDLAPDSE